MALKYISETKLQFLVHPKMSSSTAAGKFQTITADEVQKMQHVRLIFYIPHADSLRDI